MSAGGALEPAKAMRSKEMRRWFGFVCAAFFATASGQAKPLVPTTKDGLLELFADMSVYESPCRSEGYVVVVSPHDIVEHGGVTGLLSAADFATNSDYVARYSRAMKLYQESSRPAYCAMMAAKYPTLLRSP